MFREYLAADIAISAGGLTAYELIACRTPTMLIAVRRHQIHRCEYFARHKLVHYLGFKEFNHDAILYNLKHCLPLPRQKIFHTEAIKESIDELCAGR
jgi:spore coat polysaccharide biosynthesis predicted glycosyltransferase SpsG